MASTTTSDNIAVEVRVHAVSQSHMPWDSNFAAWFTRNTAAIAAANSSMTLALDLLEWVCLVSVLRKFHVDLHLFEDEAIRNVPVPVPMAT